jgi:pSer/pThr/pTyr-binding forkhead associated (FHA) protein
MPDRTTVTACLVRKSASLPSTRFPIRSDLVRIGRGLENDIVLNDEPNVSVHHVEIRRVDGSYRLYDLQSTNGTYVNGERVSDMVIQPPASIRLGTSGPELAFVLEEASADPDQTLLATVQVTDQSHDSGSVPSISPEHESLVSRAVARARRARSRGVFDQTGMFMRAMLSEALDRSARKFKIAIFSLVIVLAGVSAYAFWQIRTLKLDKRTLDAQMERIELLLEKGDQDPAETERLLVRLDAVQGQEKALTNRVLYRLATREQEDPVTRGIRSLMTEFGAETYSIPPEFLQEVNRFIQRYQGADRGTTERALVTARSSIESMQEIFEKDHLPPDLAYVALAESGLKADESSSAGAVGWWQFTPATAKHFGLRVDDQIDERRDARKSTVAAAKYIRDLILDFGAGSSVMLALAAYDVGPAKVKQAIRRVSDPIKQRDFWYLYRTRALPAETREYVPKVLAAMIIARDPEQFGF